MLRDTTMEMAREMEWQLPLSWHLPSLIALSFLPDGLRCLPYTFCLGTLGRYHPYTSEVNVHTICLKVPILLSGFVQLDRTRWVSSKSAYILTKPITLKFRYLK
jgi:hypothetical protein